MISRNRALENQRTAWPHGRKRQLKARSGTGRFDDDIEPTRLPATQVNRPDARFLDQSQFIGVFSQRRYLRSGELQHLRAKIT